MTTQNQNSSTDQTNQLRDNYVFVEKDGADYTCIRLTDDKYNDIIYKYEHVKLSQTENSDGRIPLKFTYTVIRNPNNKDTESEEFRNLIGDILVDVMELQLKNGTLKFD